MSGDKTDITNPISQVNNRLVPAGRVRQVKSVGIDVRLSQARRSFASLVAAAEDPPLQLRAVFDVTGLGKLKTGVLSKFYLADENHDGRLGFTVSFEYRGREALRHMTESEVVHNALRKALYGHGLKFRSAPSATVYRIEVEPVVPAYITISALEDSHTVNIQLSNVTLFGPSHYELPADALDRKLTDALIDLVSNGGREFYALAAAAGKRKA